MSLILSVLCAPSYLIPTTIPLSVLCAKQMPFIVVGDVNEYDVPSLDTTVIVAVVDITYVSLSTTAP